MSQSEAAKKAWVTTIRRRAPGTLLGARPLAHFPGLGTAAASDPCTSYIRTSRYVASFVANPADAA